MNDDWRNNWLALCARLQARGDCVPTGELLAAKYAESHRAYHNQEHIADCLAQFATARLLAQQPDTVELAIWFHDAVYDTHSGENEDQSAELALKFCQAMQLPSAIGERTAELILVTKSHLPGEDADAQLLIDIDLSILGQSPTRFARYEAGIRKEYAWASDVAFREGRAAVLRKFLARERIYSTPSFRDRYEESARTNLRASLARLDENAPPPGFAQGKRSRRSPSRRGT